jgi:hypothetical protein
MFDWNHIRRHEDKFRRDLLSPPEYSVQPIEEKTFDPFEEHCCKGEETETWLLPGGSEFWLIFRGDPERFTWIKYCPYCGYRPPNLRLDWANTKIPDPPFKIDGTSPVKDAHFKIAKGRYAFPINYDPNVSH